MSVECPECGCPTTKKQIREKGMCAPCCWVAEDNHSAAPPWPGPPTDSAQHSLVYFGMNGQSNLNDHREGDTPSLDPSPTPEGAPTEDNAQQSGYPDRAGAPECPRCGGATTPLSRPANDEVMYVCPDCDPWIDEIKEGV